MQAMVAPLAHQFFPPFPPRPVLTALPRAYEGVIRAEFIASMTSGAVAGKREAPTRETRPPAIQPPAIHPQAAPVMPVALVGSAARGPGRRTPPRLRVFFLRHYRACGEVKLAAERTGVALSTVYRWRERDAAFRQYWETLAEQRRQMVEDRLMRLVNEGEKTAVFYKGRQVGWRESHTPRAAVAMLACSRSPRESPREGRREGAEQERREPFRLPLRRARRERKSRCIRDLRCGPTA